MRTRKDISTIQLIQLQYDVAGIVAKGKAKDPEIYLPDVSVADLTTTDAGCGGAAATQLGTSWFLKFRRKKP